MWVSDAAMSMIARRGFGAPVIGRPMTRTEAPSPRASAGVDDSFLVVDVGAGGPDSWNDEEAVWPVGACRGDLGTGTDDPVEPGLAGKRRQER